ncbi:uncharacterized protein LOC100843588 [Anopheles sinensis]|uniref:Uncharacterized protein LOC100843588 n=1 Tax=Anopheles sinensis TaxID=74873 RepID=A0A084WL51_ANOSI|nr:uncharacterized protein LOC100843588 [Anopheles sinensis]
MYTLLGRNKRKEPPSPSQTTDLFRKVETIGNGSPSCESFYKFRSARAPMSRPPIERPELLRRDQRTNTHTHTQLGVGRKSGIRSGCAHAHTPGMEICRARTGAPVGSVGHCHSLGEDQRSVGRSGENKCHTKDLR